MNALIVNCSPVKNGATAEIASITEKSLRGVYTTRSICIADYSFAFCRGCRSCHMTAECVIKDDDVPKIVAELDWADVIVFVSPSYRADIPGQFKAFIDRCTPWCDTHEPHAMLRAGKRGYAIALRTGASVGECGNIVRSIEHFCGHLHIRVCGSLTLCSVACRENALERAGEVEGLCARIVGDEGK